VYGHGNEIIKHHMEIRGLGILNIKDLFGVASVRDRKKIELVIELVEWNSGAEYDRLGLEQESMNILGAELPHAVVPVRPGRNMTTIIEVAARNHLLKLRGHHSAQEFAEPSRSSRRTSRPAPGLRCTPPARPHYEDVVAAHLAVECRAGAKESFSPAGRDGADGHGSDQDVPHVVGRRAPCPARGLAVGVAWRGVRAHRPQRRRQDDDHQGTPRRGAAVFWRRHGARRRA
jgi:hypothetical protein